MYIIFAAVRFTLVSLFIRSLVRACCPVINTTATSCQHDLCSLINFCFNRKHSYDHVERRPTYNTQRVAETTHRQPVVRFTSHTPSDAIRTHAACIDNKLIFILHHTFCDSSRAAIALLALGVLHIHTL